MALTKPFAQNGDKKTIPENTTGDGSLSYETGFGGFYALPPEEGGLYIDRAQFNQLMYDTTSQVLENKTNISNLTSQAGQAESILNTAMKIIDEPKTSNARKVITVGTSGADFDNLQDAINEAIKYQNNVRNTGVLWDGYGGSHGSWQVVVRLTTDLNLDNACRIHLSSGSLVIDLNKKTLKCANGGFFIGTNPTASVSIINGSIVKASGQVGTYESGIRSHGFCLIGTSASFIDGELDSTPNANGFVTITGFDFGIWAGHCASTVVQANISNCRYLVQGQHVPYLHILNGTYTCNQDTDRVAGIPLQIRGVGYCIIRGAVTVSNNITSGRAQSCINIAEGSTVFLANEAKINNTGIATKCNITSNTPSANGIIFTSVF